MSVSPQTQQKLSLKQHLKQQVLLLDGAMGTSVQTFNPTNEDFQGKEGCNDFLAVTRPDIIETIHYWFLEAGADCLETNTFGSNRIKLDEYQIGDRLVEVNTAAVNCAKRAIEKANKELGEKPRYILGSMGPSGFLPSSSDTTLNAIDLDYLEDVYREQAKVLIEAGVDALLIETGQDILEMKLAVIGAKDAILESGKDILLIAQPTLDIGGRMLLGTDMAAALPLFIDLGVDVFGLNCSTGPDEMRESIRYLAENAPMAVSVIPNAGMPENHDGQAVYNLSPEKFASRVKEYVDEYGLNLVGGCCGTRPAHIQALRELLGEHPKPKLRTVQTLRVATSPINSVSFDMDNKPLIVGERLNAQGSRKFKQWLIDEDYEPIYQMAVKLSEGGSHLLDVCCAMNERDDEKDQMVKLIKQLSTLTPAPLVIDSTEKDVIEAALKCIPGRAIVNSIHLEGNGDRLHKIVPLLKRYGGSAVTMLINEDGMAKTVEQKCKVAQQLFDVVTKDYGMPAHTLIFDALTFTLATGEEEFKTSAIDTFEAIKWIKNNLEGTYTILGVSNASFGLSPAARRVLNSVYLYHAVQAGLDFAIVNAKEIIPYPMLKEEEKQVANALVFNTSDNALPDFIAYFEANSATKMEASDDEMNIERTVEEQLHWQILNRKKEGIEAQLDIALEKYPPAEIINSVLLPAMKEVGEKMATGELILPFVLQSAEVMKKSVGYLEQFLSKDDSVSKGKLVLATVYGDVHDIGKNLVKTIFSNNGYEVYDLGKQVPLPTILEKAKEIGADAIGLSALLVTTSKQMAYCVEECHKGDLNYPIIIGGAAINRDYGFRISCLGEELKYPGGVFYAKDAFEGLSVMNRLQNPEEREVLLQEYLTGIDERKKKAEEYQELKEQRLAQVGVAQKVAPAEKVPTPPFWGLCHVKPEEIDIEAVKNLMDFASLFRLSWGLRNMDKDEYEKMLKEQYYPLMDELMAWSKKDNIFLPEVLYGYFPCYSENNDLIILDPEAYNQGKQIEIERFNFPRQTERDLLCLSDYFASKDSGKVDVIAFQLVTMGPEVTKVCNQLDKDHEYSKAYYMHGLAVQLAEGLAEWTHRRIKKELQINNLPENDQGKRYSFGYPACPELGDQVKQFKLMQVEKYMQVTMTEAYQMEPEQSTSALVVHHPKAKYYSV